MFMYDLASKITESPSRPQGRVAEVAIALAENLDGIKYNSIPIERAYSHKGILTIEVNRDPSSSAEFESWESLVRAISTSWTKATGHEYSVAIVAPSYRLDN